MSAPVVLRVVCFFIFASVCDAAGFLKELHCRSTYPRGPYYAGPPSCSLVQCYVDGQINSVTLLSDVPQRQPISNVLKRCVPGSYGTERNIVWVKKCCDGKFRVDYGTKVTITNAGNNAAANINNLIQSICPKVSYEVTQIFTKSNDCVKIWSYGVVQASETCVLYGTEKCKPVYCNAKNCRTYGSALAGCDAMCKLKCLSKNKIGIHITNVFSGDLQAQLLNLVTLKC